MLFEKYRYSLSKDVEIDKLHSKMALPAGVFIQKMFKNVQTAIWWLKCQNGLFIFILSDIKKYYN